MAATEPDRLKDYRRKRSADSTPEPFGSKPATGGKSFVVQHHAARQTHYDFRLEMDGALRSWAVPKGPSPNPADKRLAVKVEDHPLEYGGFEGHIPPDNYGAGTVIVWDRGAWVPIGDPVEGLKKGKLLFELRGYKLRGKWTLVKTQRNDKDWLLIKEHDSYVSEASTDSYPPESVLSGLSVEAYRDGEDRAAPIIKKLKRNKTPNKRVAASDVGVMLAKSGRAFNKAGWLFELKYDGYRLVVARENGDVTLTSRAGNDLTPVFPEIAEVVDRLPYDHIVMDGEAVVHDERGIPSFSRLQKRGRLTRAREIAIATVELPATLYVFDLLMFGDYDLRSLPLKTRKTILRQALPPVGPVRYSDHIDKQGLTMYAHVQEMGLEGLVAKKADSRYRAGRSSDWIKITVEHTDDFAIIGYTDPKGSNTAFGALLLGVYEDGKLIYAGRAGTGFRGAVMKSLTTYVRAAPAASPPRHAPDDKDVHWIEPALVCEVKFKETTPDGVLRQPVFLHLRDDKRVAECTRELALPEPVIEVAAMPVQRTVSFTNLDKIFWPDDGYTKGDLIDYYRAVSAWLLPLLHERAVVMTRYPDGIEGKFFFQKDAPEFAPDWMRIEHMWSEHAEREIGYFIVDSEEALLYIINNGTIPLHAWSSRIGSLENPDWCILDLDPKGAPFKHVVKIARAIHELCEDIELPCFAKTSGSSGLHVLIPLGRNHTHEQSRTLAELLARVIASGLPDITTIVRSVSDREGKVYIDYLQNGHGRLLVSAFSARPLPGAPVSMPVAWKEVNNRLDPQKYNIKNALRRLRARKTDPWKDMLALSPDLSAALEKLSKRFK